METGGQPSVTFGMEGQNFSLHVIGRLRGVTRQRLFNAARATGGRLSATLSSRVNVVALGHSAALVSLVQAPPLTLPAGVPPNAELISEHTLKRRLGLMTAGPEHPYLSLQDIRRASGLEPEIVRCLSLFDVLEPVGEWFGFRDVRAAREAHRLLKLGFGLDEIVEVSVELRRFGRGLHDTSVTEAPWGELMQLVGGRTGRLNGQYVLPLEEDCWTVDELLTEAEEHESAGELVDAERLYRIAQRIDRADPVISFNLGNVLDGLGRRKEAALLYQQALALDPTFAEAWVNLAALQETDGNVSQAETSLRRALACNPAFPLVLYNLGLLLTRAGRYAEALPIWETYLAGSPQDANTALRLQTLCRMQAKASSTRRHSG